MRNRPREEERRGVARFLVSVILCLQSSVARGFLETRLLKLLKKAAQLAQRLLLNTSRESVDSQGFVVVRLVHVINFSEVINNYWTRLSKIS